MVQTPPKLVPLKRRSRFVPPNSWGELKGGLLLLLVGEHVMAAGERRLSPSFLHTLGTGCWA